MDNKFLEILGLISLADWLVRIIIFMIGKSLYNAIYKTIYKNGPHIDLPFNESVKEQFGSEITEYFDTTYKDKGELRFYISCWNEYRTPILVLGYSDEIDLRIIIKLSYWEFILLYVDNVLIEYFPKFKTTIHFTNNILSQIRIKCAEYKFREQQIENKMEKEFTPMAYKLGFLKQ